MGIDTLVQTASVIANGAQNAGQLEQARQETASSGQPAPPSPYDVLQHTGTGLASKDLGQQFMDHTPAGAMVGLFNSATQPNQSSSIGAIPDAMSQGWDAVKDAASKVGTAEGGLATFGAVMGTLQSLEQMLSMAVSAIPFPAFPAVRITDMDVGLPHAHAHPPNLIPPAPPVPLPSTGPIIPIPFVSGANKTLVNMLPAARCGDMGLGIWCGGYFPMYEVFLGSSSVWIEGNRAARLAVDITKHCVFTSPKPSDPPIGPMVGFTITSSANVLIGGVPMPSLLSLAMSAALKNLFRGLGRVEKAVRKRYSRSRPPSTAAANSAGHPIDVVSGANYDEFLDFSINDVLGSAWRRYYSTAIATQQGPLGYGFRHQYQCELKRLSLGFEYTDQNGNIVGFGPLDPISGTSVNDGILLKRKSSDEFEILESEQPIKRFVFSQSSSIASLSSIRLGDNWIQFEYRNDGELSGFRSSSGSGWTVEYDSRGLIHRVCEMANGQQTVLMTYGYDDSGHLVSAKNARGAVSRYFYDARHLMIRSENPLGYGFNFEYDSVNRCTRAFGDDGLYDVSMSYFPVERSSLAEYADGAKIEYRYDENNSLTYVSNSGGTARSYVTDSRGRVLEEMDQGGNKWEWLYDSWGGNIGRKDSLGRVLPSLATNPNPDDPNEEILPDMPGDWEWGDLLPEISSTPAGLENDPILRETPAAVYNHFLLESPKQETVNAQIARDAIGQATKEPDYLGKLHSFRRDLAGNIIELTDSDGAVFQFEYGSWNKLQRATSPTGSTVHYEYTSREYLTKVTDPGGTVSQYLYNHRDQLIGVQRHGKTRESYQYDESGNRIAKLGADGIPLIQWQTDGGNQDRKCLLAEGDTHSFEYDSNGRLAKVVWDSEQNTLERGYDENGTVVCDLRNSLGVEHDVQASLATTTYFGKFIVSIERADDGGLLLNDPIGRTHRFQFSSTGLVKKHLANGTCEIARFDSRGRLLTKVVWPKGNETPWKRSYLYSGEDELRSIADSEVGQLMYQYDPAHKLVGMIDHRNKVHSIVRDAADNICSMPGLDKVRLLDGNRLQNANGSSFRYNDRDHISHQQSENGTVHYTYNSLDQLVKVESQLGVLELRYDPLFRRTEKILNGQRTSYYWDGHRLAAEWSDECGLRIYLYVDRNSWIPFMFVDYPHLNSAPEQGNAYYIFTDQIGAPLRVQDQSGATVWQAIYEPYGRAHLSTSNKISLDLRFPGHFYDKETDLHYNRYRYYAPGLGRYLSSDPMGIAGGLNLYAYTPNPLMQMDLMGLAHGRQVATKGNRGKGESAAAAPARQSRHLRNKMKRIRNQAAAGGNRGVAGSVSEADAWRLGREFVGPGHRPMSNGKGLVSADGLRTFRGASNKRGVNPSTGEPWSQTGRQANFETKPTPDAKPTSNVHLDIE